jgi:hypothetical protein
MPKNGPGANARPKTKGRLARPFNSNPLIADQAAINAGFDFRR